SPLQRIPPARRRAGPARSLGVVGRTGRRGASTPPRLPTVDLTRREKLCNHRLCLLGDVTCPLGRGAPAEPDGGLGADGPVPFQFGRHAQTSRPPGSALSELIGERSRRRAHARSRRQRLARVSTPRDPRSLRGPSAPPAPRRQL